MINERVAVGSDADGLIRERRVRNVTVFPDPVGIDTAMRVSPDASAFVQAWSASSWYGRSCTGDAVLLLSKRKIIDGRGSLIRRDTWWVQLTRGDLSMHTHEAWLASRRQYALAAQYYK